MSFDRLARRWAAASAAGPADEVAAAARSRVSRYPPLIRLAFRVVPPLLEWLGPIVALGRIGRASALGAEDFDRLEQNLCGHRNLIVRSLYQLWRVPLAEQVGDRPDPAPVAHPLEAPGPARGEAGLDFDLVVIGSGAGGAPLAWSLARRGWRVAVVEAGEVARPVTPRLAMERYYLQQGMVVSLAGGMIPVLAGRAVGGTTVINSGTCLMPPPDRLEAWDRLAGTDFAAGGLDPYLAAVWDQLPVKVPERSLLGPSNLLIEEGLLALGRRDTYVLPRNAPDCRGSGVCCFVCPTGAKRGTDRAFLPEAVAAGCALLASTRAERVREFADGVEVRVSGPEGRRTLRCRHLVLAGGAFGTVGLIRANRLGSAWRMAGRDLRIHPASKAFAYFPRPLHGERGVPQGLGYMAPDLPRLNFEGIHTPVGVAAQIMPLAGERQRWWLDRYENVASFGMSVQDRATGRVHFGGGHPQVWYRLDPRDARDLGAGLLLVARAFFAAGAQRVLLPVLGMQAEFGAEADLDRVDPAEVTPARLLCAGFHPQGTAGIGRVVDRDQRLAGSARIWVADASVFPDSPRVNPQITIMALSLRLADRLAGASAGPATA
ncbi:MAG: GMC family oxidoreductase [Candidatus Sericytochromatia bacterium]|nr:GMC family oxidoreductase [Candidatus Tanganyikabacteria bacterium]